jgi:hypothetical protein
MATIAPQPKLQFFDANGDPLVGGRLYSYIAGTTTPQATFTDESGSTTNTNPVILDSRGEASVWFGAGTYKLALKTAADVDVWTVDNIGSDISVADLATGIQAWLGTPTSANLRTAMVDETGTGALVFANTPTLVAPAVDVITEATPAVGVTIDGVLLKDNDVSAQDVTGSATVNAPVVNATGTSSSAGVVRLYEDTDNGTNYVELKAPASLIANRSFVLPDADGTVQQFLKTDGSGNLAFAFTVVSGTLVAATGQTELTFTGIPAWVKKITIGLNGLSTSSTSTPVVQLGDSGGYETTNYNSFGIAATNTGVAGIGGTGQGGFVLTNGVTAAGTLNGMIFLILTDASTNTWVSSSTLVTSPFVSHVTGGNKALSATLDRLRLYIDGTQTFDAGSVNILYE